MAPSAHPFARMLSSVVLLLPLFGPSCGGSASAGSGGSGGTGGADSGACSATCGTGRQCCAGHCVNLANDPQNCGHCGVRCVVGEYCTDGNCVAAPCTTTCSGGSTCCDQQCCASGELCCDPQGPLATGPHCVQPSDQGTCPMGCAPLCVCASPDTPIATPRGERPIVGIAVGDLVYSVDHSAIVAVPVIAIRRMPVEHHHVLRINLKNGAIIEISAAHPTADGRALSTLHAGDRLGDVEIESVVSVPYTHAFTYDILPDSDSGAYFAGGGLVGSTLFGRQTDATHHSP